MKLGLALLLWFYAVHARFPSGRGELPDHRGHPPEVMVTLLAAYLHCRQQEITDALVDLLITTVHGINARADTKVTSEFGAELKRVSGKENIRSRWPRRRCGRPGSGWRTSSTRRRPAGRRPSLRCAPAPVSSGTSCTILA